MLSPRSLPGEPLKLGVVLGTPDADPSSSPSEGLSQINV